MKRFLKSRLFLFAEVIVLGIAIVGLVRVSIQEKPINEEISSLLEKAANEKKENEKLKNQLKSTTSNSYLELEAKRTLNYKKPEETVFVFYNPSLQVNRDAISGVNSVVSKQIISNPVRWLEYFFGADRGT